YVTKGTVPGQIWRCTRPCDGISHQPVVLLPETGNLAPQYPDEIVSDGVNVYWTEWVPPAMSCDTGSNGRVVTCPVSDCAGGYRVLASGQYQPRGIAVDAKAVYWADFGSAACGLDRHSSVWKVAK